MNMAILKNIDGWIINFFRTKKVEKNWTETNYRSKRYIRKHNQNEIVKIKFNYNVVSLHEAKNENISSMWKFNILLVCLKIPLVCFRTQIWFISLKKIIWSTIAPGITIH
jgi:hypothetical protein